MVAFMHERKSLTIMGPPLWDTKCIFSITSGLADLQKTKGHRTELQQQRLQVCEKTGYEK